MLRLLTESPLLVALMLGVLASALLYGWLQTGRKPLAISGLVIVGLIPLLWFVSEQWVTDRERIEQLIYQTADAIEANDLDTALAVIGDDATRDRAAAELPKWQFAQADVNSIRSIRLIENTDPLQADVDMMIKIDISSRSGGTQSLRLPRRLLLTLEKRGQPDGIHGGWVVTRYQHLPPVGGADAFSNQPD